MLNDTDLSQIASKFGAVSDAAKTSRAGTIAGIGFTVAEVQFGTAVAGFVNGRFQTPGKDHFSIAGLPADLLAGVAGIGTSLFGFFGPLDTHVATVSAGTLAAYSYRTAFAYGAAASEKSLEEKNKFAEQAKAQLGQGNRASNVVRMNTQVPVAAGVLLGWFKMLM